MKASELILNPDGSIYHLALMPEDIAPIVILVGDPDRTALVSGHFDRIELTKQRREFSTHTGWLGNKRITVMSTGIGTDNIDIALNELDALVNVDFSKRSIKDENTSLSIVRIGTSGSVHADLQVDEILISRYAIGTDLLGQYYDLPASPAKILPPWSYMVKGYKFDLDHFKGNYKEGITLTCPGFYAPQSRSLRLKPKFLFPIEELQKLLINGLPVSNMEMETSGIYLLAEKMGHKAISFNAILAHRLNGTFSTKPDETIGALIRDVLDWIMESH